MRRVLALLVVSVWSCAACTMRAPEPNTAPADTSWYLKPVGEVTHLLAPGDALEITVRSAPELSRQVTIAADGSVGVPYSDPIQAEGRDLDDLRAEIEAVLASELKQPGVNLALIHPAPRRIFVGGAVGQPGMYDLPGEIDPRQALIMAGGVTREGRRDEVLLIRRRADGEVKSAVIGMSERPELGVWIPLQRFDVIYVPEVSITDHGQFVQDYLRHALPAEFAEFFAQTEANS